MAQFTEPKDGEPIDAGALERQLFEAEKAASDHEDKRAMRILGQVHEALVSYRWTAERLDETAQGIMHDMEDLRRYIAQYGRPSNSLGALQARGPELDRLCGEYACRREALTRMVRIANAALADGKD